MAYRVKDAIADQFNEKDGKRPSVSLTHPDLMVNVHIADRTCTISLDSSGESLHKRGYRISQNEAPISEALAAGMLLLAGWKGDRDFIDPLSVSVTSPSTPTPATASSVRSSPSRSGETLTPISSMRSITTIATNANLTTKYTEAIFLDRRSNWQRKMSRAQDCPNTSNSRHAVSRTLKCRRQSQC